MNVCIEGFGGPSCVKPADSYVPPDYLCMCLLLEVWSLITPQRGSHKECAKEQSNIFFPSIIVYFHKSTTAVCFSQGQGHGSELTLVLISFLI